MDRKELIEKLKQARDNGAHLGIALTAKTDVLLETWERVRPKRSPSPTIHRSPIAKERNNDPTIHRSPIVKERNKDPYDVENGPIFHSGIWNQLLPKLQLRTIYRLAVLNKEAIKVLTNRFWKGMIERDLGVVPDFVTNYRWYYMKSMNFGVPLNVYELEQDKVAELDRGVVLSNKHFKLYSNNTILNTETGQLNPIDLIGRSIRAYVDYVFFQGLLSTDGRLYDLDGKEEKLLLKLPKGEIFFDFHDETILTKSGKVYIITDRTTFHRKIMQTPIDEPIISLEHFINVELLSKSGKYYQYAYRGPVLLGNTVNEVGRFEARNEYKVEKISEEGSLYIQNEGKVVDRKTLRTIFDSVSVNLSKYFMVSVYKVGRGYYEEYNYRGFKL